MDNLINYYDVLGVSRTASQSEIKAAFRRLAKDRHPDHRGGSEAEFAHLKEAYEVLSNPNRRAAHDEALDLAHAANQLSDLEREFSKLDDELAAKRREREAESASSFGERLSASFKRRRNPPAPHRRPQQHREARWYEPHALEPEPINWKSGSLSFIGAFLAFLIAGQLGLWAIRPVSGVASWAPSLGPYLPFIYAVTGLVATYLAYRAAGYLAVALVFIASLVVGSSGGPAGLLQFSSLGIITLLAVIFLGNRRNTR